MHTATLVKDLPPNTSGAHWRIYRLDPPMDYTTLSAGHEGTTEYVVVSANVLPFTGPETYIFASDGQDVTDWGELDGSFRGACDHARALSNAGYQVVSP